MMNCKCPTTVPTFPWKGCEDNGAILHADTYGWDTGMRIRGFGEKSLLLERPKYNVALSVTQDNVKTLISWYKNSVDYGALPFALYGDYEGDPKWYIVKFIDNKQLDFSYANNYRDTTIKVYILGYAQTIDTGELTDDAGNPILDDAGNVITADGVASDITCYPTT